MLSIAGTVQTIIAAVLLRGRLQGLEFGRVALRALWFLAAALVAGAAGAGVLALLGGIGDGAFPVSGPVGGVVSMAVAGASMAARLPRDPLADPQSRAPRVRRADRVATAPPVARERGAAAGIRRG